jgi:FtsP/CotA-like multicopper oxidase with cupredoxin domain
MRLPRLRLHARIENDMGAGHRRGRSLCVAARWLSAALVAAAGFAFQARPAPAQTPAAGAQGAQPSNSGVCPPEMMTGRFLFKVPELAANGGRLRGTILLSDEPEWMAFRRPVSAPADSSTSQCFEQHVRIFRGLDTIQYVLSGGTVISQKYAPRPVAGGLALPMPGPTLRARVGDLVQLTFINQINANNFIESIDRGETGEGGGCDATNSGYPGSDKYPDCFHGSSTGNIHFHGTHTNPNTTGDNVFIEVRPSPLDANNRPVVTPASVKPWFDDFYTRCERELSLGFGAGSMLKEWPTSWGDMPKGWTDRQQTLLQQYDAKLKRDYPQNNVRQLWPVDAAQIAMGAWPQYYIGSFPYCFRLPVGPPKPPPAGSPKAGTAGAGTAETGHAGMNMGGGATAGQPQEAGSMIRMGQAPGTHWYHAHKHGSTAINVANGMTGAFIIEGQYDDDLNTFYGKDWTRTQPLMVINQLGASPNLMRGAKGRIDKGPDLSVNGQLKPVVKMRPGEVQMWRLVNTSGRAGVFFTGAPVTSEGKPAGFQWKQLAQDGVQFSDGNYQQPLTTFLLASGNRADLLVKAPTTPGDYPLMVQNMVDVQDLQTANRLTLLTVSVGNNPSEVSTKYATEFIPKAPAFPGFLASVRDEEIKATKRIVFKATGPGLGTPGNPGNRQMIDGKEFDGEVGQVVLLNTAEEWKIENDSIEATVSHPFHIHINPFQVTAVFDPNELVCLDPQAQAQQCQSTKVTAVKYPFSQADISTNPDLAKLQCPMLDPNRPDTWAPCFPGQTFQGQPAPTNLDNIWWDVFPIPSGRLVSVVDAQGHPVNDPATGKQKTVRVPGYFKMRSRFVDFPGFYVIHCHILAHEDRGMMTIVEVAPVRTPYSHH